MLASSLRSCTKTRFYSVESLEPIAYSMCSCDSEAKSFTRRSFGISLSCEIIHLSHEHTLRDWVIQQGISSSTLLICSGYSVISVPFAGLGIDLRCFAWLCSSTSYLATVISNKSDWTFYLRSPSVSLLKETLGHLLYDTNKINN